MPLKIISFLTLTVGLFFSYTVLSHAINFPNADDFDSFLDFLNRFYSSTSQYDSLALLFERHTQHFRTIDRATALIAKVIFGQMNFILFNLIGLIGIFLTYHLLVSQSQVSTKYNKQIGLIAALLVFQPIYLEATQWANTCIQFIWINVFAILALRYSRSNIIISILFCLLSLLVQGNGILVFPIIIAMRLANKEFNKQSMYFILAFLISLVAFRFDQVLSSNTSQTPDLLVFQKILYGFKMLGSSLGYYNENAALYSGLFLTCSALFFWLTAKKSDDILIYFLIFLILSCLATAQFRMALDPESSYRTSRYTLVSILAVVSFILLASNRLKQKNYFSYLINSLLALSLLFNISEYFHGFDQYNLRYELLEDSNLRWSLFKKGLAYSPSLRAEQILNQSESLGVFNPKSPDINKFLSHAPKNPPIFSGDKSKITWGIDHRFCNNDYFLIDGWAALKNTNSKTQNIYLEAGQNKFFLSQKRSRPDVSILLTKKRYSSKYNTSGFLILVKREELSPQDNKLTLFFTSESGPWGTRTIDLSKICASFK